MLPEQGCKKMVSSQNLMSNLSHWTVFIPVCHSSVALVSSTEPRLPGDVARRKSVSGI